MSGASGDAPFAIAAPAVRLCAAWSRSAKRYLDLDVAEREALADVERGIAEIARTVAEAAGLPGLRWCIGPAETGQTGGARVLPRSLWVSFALPERPPGTPACEVFAALGPDGLDIGFAARAAPRDRTTASLQKWFRQSAPEVFGILKRQRQQGIRPGDWAFTVRDAPLLVDDGFADVNAWLQFQFGQQDERSRTAVISRTLPQSEWNDLAAKLIGATRLFGPLIAPTAAPAVRPTGVIAATDTYDISAELLSFLERLAPLRDGPFTVSAQLTAAARRVEDALVRLPELLERPHLDVHVALGDGNWLPTPWIGFGDRRAGPSATYAGLLISADLSTVTQMLYHGTRYRVLRFGGRSSVAAMQRSVHAARSMLDPLAAKGFTIDRQTHLLGETEIDTQHETALVLQSTDAIDALATSEDWRTRLRILLEGYDNLLALSRSNRATVSDPTLTGLGHTAEAAKSE